MNRENALLWRGMGAVVLFELLFSLTPLMGQSSQGQPGQPHIRSEVDTTIVTVGDRITLQVWVIHPADSRVIWPDSLAMGPFEVLGARALPPVTQGEMTESSLALALSAFELGELEIPHFEVVVEGPDGTGTALETDRFGIRVVSVGLDESGDIRDIRGPVGIPVNLFRVLFTLMGVILMAGLAWAAFRRFRRKGGTPEIPVSLLPLRPPHEVALEALARLEASPLLERGEVKEYHIQVSEVLRIYVEGRFKVPALEMTTLDITAGLERAGVARSILEGFGRFLHECDMVKFAKSRPELEVSRSVLDLGRDLVEKTIPAPDEEEPVPTGDVLPKSDPTEPDPVEVVS